VIQAPGPADAGTRQAPEEREKGGAEHARLYDIASPCVEAQGAAPSVLGFTTSRRLASKRKA
jgi:hypothetical protein